MQETTLGDSNRRLSKRMSLLTSLSTIFEIPESALREVRRMQFCDTADYKSALRNTPAGADACATFSADPEASALKDDFTSTEEGGFP